MNQMVPHLYFNGKCLDAINFYLHIFKGEIEALDKYKDAPIAVSKENENKIMLVDFRFWGGSFYASDLLQEKLAFSNPTIGLTLNLKSETELNELYKSLSENGQILAAPNTTYLGNLSTEFIDQFGVRWRLHCS